MEDDWITTKDAAAKSGYHPEHIRELIREGKIDGRKFGIVWQVNKKSLFQYLENATKQLDRRWGPKKR
jgi:excisionase family DNA binding protein